MQQLIQLPTGTSHLSYNEIKDWSECSFRHKLVHIDGIDLREESADASFGKAIHDACQNYLVSRKMDKTIAINRILKSWDENGFENIETWINSATDILGAIPEFLNLNFPNWEYIGAEEKLDEIFDKLNIKFKGYIDGIIRTKDKNGKWIYHIIDWKTAASDWSDFKKRKFLIRMQLIYYKFFWARKHKLDPAKVNCAFIILKKDGNEKRCQLIKVKAGKKSMLKCLSLMEQTFDALVEQKFIKNRLNCTYCQFLKTTFCPAQKL